MKLISKIPPEGFVQRTICPKCGSTWEYVPGDLEWAKDFRDMLPYLACGTCKHRIDMRETYSVTKIRSIIKNALTESDSPASRI